MSDINLTEDEIIKIGSLLLKTHGEQMKDVWILGCLVGMRIDELLSIKFTDIDDGSLQIKTSKARKNLGSSKSLILTPQALDLISNIHKKYPEDIYVFQSRNSRNIKNREAKPISRQYIYSAFKEVSDIINRPVTASTMRQVMANKLHFK